MYRIEIEPMPIFDANLYHQVLRFKRSFLERTFGVYVCSGQNIYLLNELEESISFPVAYKGQQLTVNIDADTMRTVMLSGEDSRFENADNDIRHTLINIIIKQAFRDTQRLKQVGKSPRFFDHKNPILTKEIKILSGFKASAINN